MMKVVEFETKTYNKVLHLPDGIPEGKKVRVLLLYNDDEIDNRKQKIKSQLTTLTEGLSEEDLARQKDTGREDIDWLT
ncbi:MAG: hypothetical protein ACOCX9_06900 [Spirochaetota bacterium]